ncbi:MAG TPA: RNA polymerase sigma factor [Chthonomonadaceae bacterium]|nr:RNA polymerase sigma factor [Chthonomonadaceae bacterium]
MRDHALVKRILRGDRAAGEQFVAENYPRIFRLLRYLTGERDTAEDLTQQTFTRAWQALPGFKGESSAGTWLHRIAYHEYTHWLRAQRPHVGLEAAAEIADPRTPQSLETILLPAALAQLPLEQREAFLLYYVQELSIVEVAEVLEIPAGTVKSRLFAARQRLRVLLQDSVEAGPSGSYSSSLDRLIQEAVPDGLSTSPSQHRAD